MSRAKRSTTEYLASAKANSRYVPGLKKYKRRKDLDRWEKAAITRAEKKLKGLYNLKPLTPKQAKLLKDVLPNPGVNALQLSNIGETYKIHVTDRRDMFITTNGRTWVYWQQSQLGAKLYEQLLDEGYSEEEAAEYVRDENQKIMRDAGKTVFNPNIREAFPVEKILRLAEQAFKKPTVKMIGLWTDKGRVGEGFRTFDEFRQWVYADFSTYANTEKWVNGIAILIADRGERISQKDWSNRTTSQIEEDRKQRRAVRRAKQRRARQ